MARQADRSAATTRRLLDTARMLFARDGYDRVSIDLIVAEAGLTKGAFYHHFASKQAVFERVLDEAQAGIAARQAEGPGPAPGTPATRSLSLGAVGYLRLANDPSVRRILLDDGPRVLGWERWREIDDVHFAGRVRGALTQIMGADAPLVDAATRVVLGAIMEAALASGRADDPDAVVARYGETIEQMLEGFAASR